MRTLFQLLEFCAVKEDIFDKFKFCPANKCFAVRADFLLRIYKIMQLGGSCLVNSPV
jgi:hypothetical protein